MKTDTLLIIGGLGALAYLVTRPAKAPVTPNPVASLLGKLGVLPGAGGGVAPVVNNVKAGGGSGGGASGGGGTDLSGSVKAVAGAATTVAAGAKSIWDSLFGSKDTPDSGPTSGRFPQELAQPDPPSGVAPQNQNFDFFLEGSQPTVDTPASSQDLWTNFDSFGNDVSYSFA